MTIIVIVLVLVLLAGWIISTQRRLVVMDENVNNAMSQIGVQLSSRFDALPHCWIWPKGTRPTNPRR